MDTTAYWLLSIFILLSATLACQIIKQHQNVVIYSNFKPAWLLDTTPLFKLQFLK
jgi:hypothetical protein